MKIRSDNCNLGKGFTVIGRHLFVNVNGNSEKKIFLNVFNVIYLHSVTIINPSLPI